MADTPRLDLPKEWTGHWWLPDDPSHTVPGVLRYDPEDGLSLLLIGGFEYRNTRPIGNGGVAVMEGVKSWPLVLGVTGRRRVTLVDCAPKRSEAYAFGSPYKQTVSAVSALVGVHLDEVEQAIFTECQVSVENLRGWANSSALIAEMTFTDDKAYASGTIITTPVEEPSVVVDGTTITLAHQYGLPHLDDQRGRTVGKMGDTVFVRCQSPSPFSLARAWDYAKAVQDLVSLATHTASGTLWFLLRVLPDDRGCGAAGYPTQDREVAVYSKGILLGDASAKAVDQQEMLFTCEDISFEDVIARWWRVRQTFQAASNMVLGLRYAPAHYIENNLLTAVGAAEVLHRALGLEETRMPEGEFEELRATLLEQTPQRHRNWVKSVIHNNVTLRERLQALAKLPDPEALGRLVPDVEQWASLTSRARNQLAHTGETPQYSLDELVVAADVTSAVVVMNLLQALGVPGERQRRVVEENSDLRWTAKEAAKYLTKSKS